MSSRQPVSSRPVHGFEKVRAALTTLSTADYLRLTQIARLRSLGTRMAGEDLLQEAVTRALAGQRQWPQDVPFVAFLAQTMRSIAFEERADAAQELLLEDAGLTSSATVDLPHSGHSDDVTPERQYAAKQMLEAVDNLFEGDEGARGVLAALGEDRRPEDIKAEFSLTQTQYATILRRIRRRLDSFTREQTK